MHSWMSKLVSKCQNLVSTVFEVLHLSSMPSRAVCHSIRKLHVM